MVDKGMALNSRFRAIPLLSALVALLSASPLSVNATPRPDTALSDSAPKGFQGLGFFNPTDGGGSWLTNATVIGNHTYGEPLNIVVSANSDPYIMTESGFEDWCLSIQYSKQPGDITLGGKQSANLGDGNGQREQIDLLRFDYSVPVFGTLNETLFGGSHFRYWLQNGPNANSSAWFLAASVEMSLAEHHMIVPNGYDRGRDEFVGNATASNGTLSPATKFTFSATSQLLPFLPANSSAGINHDIKTDGNVAIVTVKVTNNNPPPTSGSTAVMPTVMPAQIYAIGVASTVLSLAIASFL
ncbi:BZ3500_MvSof-1268-A1-R1_Chr2-1g04153 [Microbotryum saponariae]|uniref:BZ3500_MvSof-1268-A1-R1_Chr2-1g04153 protein n=1 Tax=Microbotryum saponariae TaxID=289078 RepID=A0A2X0MAK0_9BASI|nr:BZ3500_MvSof-1268-A1-R1_Chr2-1g04153 [Microbotryum saponariae]SCZ91140.1 BZ3501_MvSof-1269-A2-R1_Chr2-1g03809 [Microbotryum saponariae]